MKNLILIGTFVLLNTLCKAQSTIELTLKNKIADFFIALKDNDTLKLNEIIHPNATMNTIQVQKKDTTFTQMSAGNFKKLIVKMPKMEWDEKILNYAFQLDELMAVVTTEYDFTFKNKTLHTGINVFTFMKTNKTWKIISISDTRYPKKENDLQREDYVKIESDTIHKLMNNWHLAATNANIQLFFKPMSDSCIYKGTDKTERWNKKEFYGFCEPYFAKGKAWDFIPIERHISLDDNLQTAWVDEKLETWMGICKATAVLQKEFGVWKIVLYDLSMTVDNDKVQSVIELHKN